MTTPQYTTIQSLPNPGTHKSSRTWECQGRKRAVGLSVVDRLHSREAVLTEKRDRCSHFNILQPKVLSAPPTAWNMLPGDPVIYLQGQHVLVLIECDLSWGNSGGLPPTVLLSSRRQRSPTVQVWPCVISYHFTNCTLRA